MAKRKAQDVFEPDTSPSKRVTRSSATLKAVQPLVFEASTPTRRKRGGQIEPATPRVPPLKRVYGRKARVLDSSSHKENENTDEGDKDESEADELNIGPENKQLEEERDAPTKRSKRVVFDAIVIDTPTRQKKINQSRTKAQVTSFNLSTNVPDSPAERSPSKKFVTRALATSSPTKSRRDESGSLSISNSEASVKKPPVPLPSYLLPCLNAQKRVILDAILAPSHGGIHLAEDDEPAANTATLQQLCSLLSGTIRRGEGNSCLVIGPAGSGKTKVRVARICFSYY